MALLAAFSMRVDRKVSLADYLDATIGMSIGEPVAPRAEDVRGFEQFFDRYTAGLPVEAAAVEHI
jgi:hypothetical protein